jgi:hypothetical protein
MSEKLIELIDFTPELTLEEKVLIKRMFPEVKENLGTPKMSQKEELKLLSNFIAFLRVCRA